MTDYKLTYFNARGLAETSRLLFKLAEVEFEDVRIQFKGPGQSSIPPEIKEKLPYGQLPFLEVGDLKLSQSGSINRFLAKKFNLYGANDLEHAKVDEIMDSMKDYQDSFRPLHSGTDEEKAVAKKNIAEVTTPKYLGKYNQILEKNGTGFLVGSSVTLADVQLFGFITSVNSIANLDIANGYPAVQALVTKVGNIPQIKKWVETRPKTVF